MERLISLLGLGLMILIAWTMSSAPRRVSLRVVAGGLFLQFAFAVLVLRTDTGFAVFQTAGDFFVLLLDFVDVGSSLVFGENRHDFIFAFNVLPTIIFFSSLMSVLYHYNVMQQVIKVSAIVMQRTLGTSGAESLSTAANVFVGQTEAPLVIRPYVETMTQSELMAIMVGGFATIAGGVLAAYIGMHIDASHLLTASVISAPATLVIAKIMQPEVEHPKTMGIVDLDIPKESVNGIHAAAIGAADGAKLAINVAAMLIAFIALLAMLNYGVARLGQQFGFHWSIELFLGYLFAPMAWSMGIPWNECLNAGELMGLRLIATEFVAYERLGEWINNPADAATHISRRAEVILTYALCGFANIGSIGIQIGGIGPLAPSRQGDLARLGLRAMIGGVLANNMTACVAGALIK